MHRVSYHCFAITVKELQFYFNIGLIDWGFMDVAKYTHHRNLKSIDIHIA